jgi:hypothetical protein
MRFPVHTFLRPVQEWIHSFLGWWFVMIYWRIFLLTGLDTINYASRRSQILQKTESANLLYNNNNNNNDNDNDNNMPPLNQSYGIMQTSDDIEACFVAVQPKSPEKKRVLFADDVEIQEISYLLDLTEEEKASLWMTPIDWMRTRHENRNVVLSVLDGQDMDDLDEDETTRGLESYFPDIVIERRQNIQFVRTVVLRTQNAWRRQGTEDARRLAFLYFTASAKSRESALTRGILDILDASA